MDLVEYRREAIGSTKMLGMTLIYMIVVSCILLFFCGKAFAYTPNQIADAIYMAEGGEKTSYPYGILTKYKTTTPRQACINTINSALKRFANQTKETDFIVFLGSTYCPVEGDTTGLNKNWVKNVKYFLKRGKKCQASENYLTR